MIEKTKREYAAPMVELIEARVEKGFQTSTPTPNSVESNALNSYVDGGNVNNLFT